MPALLKKNRLAGTAADLQRHKLAVCGLGALALTGLLASSLLMLPLRSGAALSASNNGHLSFRQIASVEPGSRWGNSPWAGGLEAPVGHAAGAGQPEQPLTSASYTSGFDKKAVGLGPLPQTAEETNATSARNPLACPDDLNCSFRPARAGGVAIRHHGPALDTASNDANANSVANAGIPASGPKTAPHGNAARPDRPNGFALLTSFRFPTHLPTRLPSASTLLKPFTFVSNTVVGFVKKL
jgi:hypothetical protein